MFKALGAVTGIAAGALIVYGVRISAPPRLVFFELLPETVNASR